MKSKKKRSNDAVADIVGTVMMLGMAVSLIAMVYISVLSYPFTPSPISADLIGSVDGNSIIIEHHGGDSLSLSTEIVITVGGSATRITVEDYLDDESKADGLWNIGERVVYSDETLTSLEVKVAVVDTKSNSAILMGILQEGETSSVPSLITSVDTINPYTQITSSLIINAAGDPRLDNVTLYYRWSEYNWTMDWSTLIYDNFEDGTSGNYSEYDGDGGDAWLDSGSEIDGTYSLHLEDDTGSNWYLTNDITANTNGYSQIIVEFKWKVDDFNNPGTEDWWFQYYNGSSSSWETVEDFDCGVGTKIDQQSDSNWDGAGSETYYFNESEGWSLSDNFNIRFYCDASGNGDELYIDSIYINATTGEGSRIDWQTWNDASNPDTSYSWSWNFDFPNSTGYYEFYSIGKYQGDIEIAPISADAICDYNLFIPLTTSVNTISPYVLTSSPHTIYATGSSYLDNVTLWYYYSADNSTWWNSSWTYREKLTIDHDQVAGDLTNFPVLVSITDSNLSSKAQSDGDDIVFTNATGTKLNHEIELCNDTTGELLAWVNVTSLSGSSDTEIYIYYGNSSCSSQENIDGVWDSNFVMVQHLQETDIDDGADDIKDSTSKNNDGTTTGMNTADQVPGKVDGSFDFDGDNDYINVEHNSALNPSNITVSIWFKLTNTPSDSDGFIHKDVDWNWDNGYGLSYTSNSLKFMFGKGVNIVWQNAATIAYTPETNNWHHLVGTFDGTTRQIYLDSVAGTSNSEAVGDPDGSTSLVIGKATSPETQYTIPSLIDEVRISNTDRSDVWINTCYNNQKNQSTFISIGNEDSWIEWSNTGNPDVTYPWSWSFDFPNGTGYYEFYSIGRYNGDVEAAPGSADAMCKYEG